MVAKAFKRALAENRLDVAEHLLLALERLERGGPDEAALDDAYFTLCGKPVSKLPKRRRMN